jgi:TRAP-type C4-dicarboxylate transport system substrate-binding protein
MTVRATFFRLFGVWLMLLLGSAEAQVVIRMGTVAPEGSVWHDALLETRQRWLEVSNREVELRIYPGGVLGGEDEMLRKMQRRGLEALAVSGSGLPLIDSIVDCLQVPMLFESHEELEHVRRGIEGELEASFEEQGYKLLNWVEAGWVHFFSRSPVRTPDDLRALRLWIATGAPETERLFKQLGFRVVALPVTDMLTGLQTGLIDAIDVPPLFALLDRSYQVARYMTDVKFAPLNGATVMTLAAWQRIPEAHHEGLLDAARAAADRLQTEVRRAEEEAVREMQMRNLEVVPVDAATVEAWRAAAREVYGQLACAREHPELFERVVELKRAFAGRAPAR